MESSTRLEPAVPVSRLGPAKVILLTYAGRDLLLSDMMGCPAIRSLNSSMQHDQGDIIFARLTSGEILDRGENRKQRGTRGRTAGVSRRVQEPLTTEFRAERIAAFHSSIRVSDERVARQHCGLAVSE